MGECVHHIALSRLYWGPNRLISCPRMTKFAATRGVGAMIVVDILSWRRRSCKVSVFCDVEQGHVLHKKRVQQRWVLARP